MRSAVAVLVACVAAAGAATQCHSVCNDGVHICDASSECNLCMPTPPNSTTSFKCLAGCGNKCSTDDHCGSAGCQKCVDGTCSALPPATPPPQPPQTCGGVCNDGIHNCGTTSECNLCIPEPANQNQTFLCKAGCGNKCTADANCGSAGCGKCVNGTCTATGPAPGPIQQCNGPCTVNTDCDKTGECNICVPKDSSSFMCSAPCQAKCTSDAHCGVSNCQKCINGTCQHAPPAPPAPVPATATPTQRVCCKGQTCASPLCFPNEGSCVNKQGQRCWCAFDAQCYGISCNDNLC